MSLSSDMLEQARKLASLDKLRPKQANLRRSISSSYYALFHFLSDEVTQMVAGATPATQWLRHLAARSFEHTSMKKVCQEFGKSTPASDLLKPHWQLIGVPASVELRTVAEAFVELQELRHEADYDRSASFTRQDAEEASDLADQAMKAWPGLKQHQPKIHALFSLSLILWPSLGKR